MLVLLYNKLNLTISTTVQLFTFINNPKELLEQNRTQQSYILENISKDLYDFKIIHNLDS